MKQRNFRLLTILLSFWFVFFYIFGFCTINGPSMSPTFKDGRLILVSKVHYKMTEPKRGDIVLVSVSFEDLIKRIIGTGGDEIEITDGYIFVNGSLIKDKFKNKRISFLLVDENDKPLREWGTNKRIYRYLTQDPIVLKKGEFFMIGDNREVSWYGTADKKDIMGKIMFH